MNSRAFSAYLYSQHRRPRSQIDFCDPLLAQFLELGKRQRNGQDFHKPELWLHLINIAQRISWIKIINEIMHVYPALLIFNRVNCSIKTFSEITQNKTITLCENVSSS